LRERRVHGAAQRFHDLWQGIGEIFVFAAAEAMPVHDDPAAECIVLGVIAAQDAAFLARKRGIKDGGASEADGAGEAGTAIAGFGA